jgi:hypothetical protein
MFLLNSRAFAATIPRPFSVRYNPYTLCVEVIDSKDQIINLTKTIKGNNIDKYNFDITTWNLDSILKKNLKKNISELKLCFVGFLAHHLASIICRPLAFHV